jgi:spore coat polysaccharide biosynthesis predicted glycosyltransferase SpsG
MPRPVLIIADAGAGLGHLSRSSAIGVALRCRGVEARCHALAAEEVFVRDGIVWSPLADDELPASDAVLVVDAYEFPIEDVSGDLVVMHDHGGIPENAALVVSVAAEPGSDGRMLSGPRYAALRPHFWGAPRRVITESVINVLVTVGSGQFADVGRMLAEALSASLAEAEVTLVQGPDRTVTTPDGVTLLDAPESLLGPLLDADLVVSAAGQTMLEALAAGTPCVALPLADNQRRQATRLGELGAITLVDAIDAAVEATVELAQDADERRRLSRLGQDTVDGFGALRVGFAIDRLARLD